MLKVEDDIDLLISSRRKNATLSVPQNSVSVPQLTNKNASSTNVPASAVESKVLEIQTAEFEHLKLLFIPTAIQQLLQSSSSGGVCTVFDHHSETKPKCFIYRAKPNTQPCQLTKALTVRPVSMVGRGAFGYAIVMTTVKSSGASKRTTEKEESHAYKVDADKLYVVWEAFIHSVVSKPQTFD